MIKKYKDLKVMYKYVLTKNKNYLNLRTFNESQKKQ